LCPRCGQDCTGILSHLTADGVDASSPVLAPALDNQGTGGSHCLDAQPSCYLERRGGLPN
jgi:hypothetical protein